MLAVALLQGCTSTHISKVGDSWTVVRKGWGTKQSIGELQVVSSTNGVTLKLRGYSNDQVDAVGVAVGAAVEAAVKGAKP